VGAVIGSSSFAAKLAVRNGGRYVPLLSQPQRSKVSAVRDACLVLKIEDSLKLLT